MQHVLHNWKQLVTIKPIATCFLSLFENESWGPFLESPENFSGP